MTGITQRQRDILDSFKVVRLTSSEEDLRIVGTFSNSKNETLSNKIQSDEAFDENEKGSLAYYLVKSPDDRLLFYFSLKCGQLFDELFEKKLIDHLKKLFKYFDKIEKEISTSEEDIKLIKEIRERFRSSKGVSKADLDKIQKKDKAVTDLEAFFTDHLQSVGRTFAGIEIVEFCLNENEREYMHSFDFFPHFGAIVFWHCIVPIIMKVREYVGCQYLFLFAADLTEDERLIRYYKGLNFTDEVELKAVIPIYDNFCRFMYQDISTLEDGKKHFFDNFNLDEEDV